MILILRLQELELQDLFFVYSKKMLKRGNLNETLKLIFSLTSRRLSGGAWRVTCSADATLAVGLCCAGELKIHGKIYGKDIQVGSQGSQGSQDFVFPVVLVCRLSGGGMDPSRASTSERKVTQPQILPKVIDFN